MSFLKQFKILNKFLIKKIKNNFEAKLKPALEWLSNENNTHNVLGEKTIYEVLEEANLLSSKLNPLQANNFNSLTSEIKNQISTLNKVSKNGEVIKIFLKRFINNLNNLKYFLKA